MVPMAFAYSGGFATSPPLLGGPSSNTITNFDLDTREDNPQTIVTNLDFVQRVIIETATGIKSHILITENPSSGQLSPGSFSFTVPQKVQDELVRATIYFWGPDQETLLVDHIHQGQTTEQIAAVRAAPEQTDAQGRVLWVITTTSFSEFIPLGTTEAQDRNIIPFVIYAALIALATLSAIVLLRTD
ncbi:MAG: hypothetical protein C4541_11565 [Candidatus Auribacter fodinae]|uniref:Uncharacterized protein n=1 Tax=Candidatus Auribacter fodinae TaxID=2093366 RepID=A0A3A4R5L5_9BACT|nr:MAG: hypothetical protein C4541_11565 [Candidatus Auribacter fodinae]